MERNRNNVLRYLKCEILPRLQKRYGTELKAVFESASDRRYVVMDLIFDYEIDRVPFGSLNSNHILIIEEMAKVLTRKTGLNFTARESGWVVSW